MSSHKLSKQPWGVIDLDTIVGRIFLQEEWYYHWFVMPHASPWTLGQKRAFHHAADNLIWQRWSNRLKLPVRGSHPLCAKFGSTGVPINFDIKWVTAGGHWTVNAYKSPPRTSPGKYRANVTFSTRVINLYSSSVAPYEAENEAGRSRGKFQAIPHEYGHTFNNPDEYNAGSPFLADDASTMNIGDQIRSRHLKLVVDTLNTLLPGAVFSAP